VNPLTKAKALSFLLPAALLAGALGSQYLGGLHPCEMCYWQRWPHEAALMFAILAFAARKGRAETLFLVFAALAIIASGAIGAFHAGVEYGWWEGLTRCSRLPGSVGGDIIKDIMATPLVRCDTAQWTLGGISLAGFNAMISVAGGLLILNWLRKVSA
jgi:disulfide bond formation protein DsbB